jgi:predicted anti-sigma-YlaC factor YlaD
MMDLEAVTCQELVELVTDYLEGALTPAELRRFEEHIAECDGCREYLAQLCRTIELIGTLTLDDLTPEAESELLYAFRGWHAGPTAPDR